MKRIVSFLLFSLPFIAAAQVSVVNLLTENLPDPIGLDMVNPRFSWQLSSENRNVVQTAFEVHVMLDKKQVWKSGKIQSDQTVFVPYAGAPLLSGKKYHWQVRVWDGNGKESEWSNKATFQTGFFSENDWKAKWISPGFVEEQSRPSPIFRKEFNHKKKIKSATAYITAHGLYEAAINGKRIGDAYFTPGWTSYNKRLQYQVYDVTNLIRQGQNAIGVTLGNGWYRGNIAWEKQKDVYGEDISLLFQLDIEYSDGQQVSISSDESWKSSTGSIRYAEIYHGETIDARLENTGWQMPGFSDAAWSGVEVNDYPMDILTATYNEPVKKQETFAPVEILTSPKGETILDFGQNLVGWVVVKANGQSGDRIVLSHTEVLDKVGNFYTESLRAAKQQNTYILKGGGPETFEPHFTWQGFRYVRIDAYPGEVTAENFTAVALYSDMRPTGKFTTSHPLINQLQHNIQWGQKGNFLDVPTDCPQRDERLGWTGDAQAFSRTATFNFDVHNFFAKWLKDLSADQWPDGKVPYVVPHVLGQNAGGSAGWADAATIIPWNMYLVYGDRKILEDQYESMKSWVGFMTANSKDFLWNKGFHFGDWLFYSVNNDTDGTSAITDKYFIAQCFYAHSTHLLIQAAEVLGKVEDVVHYTALLENIKRAFLLEYTTLNGATISNTQTSYVLALQFDLLPERLRQQAADRLAENIKRYNTHLTTGFLGTPYLCHVLSRFGYTDLAFEWLLQKTYPSWLYPVTMGATTIWERWDGIRPDSSFQNPTMNSFNHYAYGAIGDWMYRVLAGIDLDEGGIGFKKIRIQPHIGRGFTAASALFETVYGQAGSSWKIEKGELIMEVTIPANTSARVFIPATSVDQVRENGQVLTTAKYLTIVGMENGFVVLKMGSGTYQFTAPAP